MVKLWGTRLFIVGVMVGTWVVAYQAGRTAGDLDAANRDREILNASIADRDEAIAKLNEMMARPAKVVTREIVKTVEADSCQRVSPDVLRLLNE